jgi:raffinose/stachyose/melibiose transport system substrate-binding protein
MIQRGHSRLLRFRTLAAVAALGTLVLAGCGGGDGDSGGDGGAAKSFKFTFPTSTATESPWQTLATKYQEETGTQVQAQALPNDSYPLTIRTQLQGGNAPDLMVVAPGAGQQHAVLPLAEADLLEPLNEQSASVVPENTKPLVSLDGKVYAQPTDLIPVGMAYNPDAATKAGVTTFPSDSSAMIASCKQLAGQGKSFLAVAGSAPPNMGLMALSISATRVYAQTPDWNQQRASGAVTFAGSKGWQDTLQTIVDMNNSGCFQRGAAGGGFDAITGGLTQGKSLGAFVPGGAATELMASTPGLKLEIRDFPPAVGGEQYLLASPNYALAISAKSDAAQKQAAQGFLDWLAKPENAAQFTKISGGVPITGVEGATLEPQYEPVKGLLEAEDYAPLPNLEWPNPGIYDALSSGVQGLVAGKGDVQSVLEATDKAWDR